MVEVVLSACAGKKLKGKGYQCLNLMLAGGNNLKKKCVNQFGVFFGAGLGAGALLAVIAVVVVHCR